MYLSSSNWLDALSGRTDETIDETALASEYRQIAEDIRYQGLNYFENIQTFVLPHTDNTRTEKTPTEQLFASSEWDHHHGTEKRGGIKVLLEPEEIPSEEEMDNKPPEPSQETENTIEEGMQHLAEVYFENVFAILDEYNLDPERHGLGLEFNLNVPVKVPSNGGGTEIQEATYSLHLDTKDVIEKAEEISDQSFAEYSDYRERKKHGKTSADIIIDGIPEAIEETHTVFHTGERYEGSNSIRHLPSRG